VPPELRLRRYRPADAGAVWTLHERALCASAIEFVEDAPADGDLRRIESTYLDDGEFLLGLWGEEPVAMGGLAVDGDAGEVVRMRVDPDRQRRRYGSLVLSALTVAARERGLERLRLETNAELGATAFYRARGFEEVDRKRHPETGVEVVRFERGL
jgi:GNAT superfamily N-acetyltransferase